MGAKTLQDGRNLRDSALSSFERSKSAHLLRARRIFLLRLLERGTATVDEVHSEMNLPEGVCPKILGCVPVPFARGGVIERSGYQPAQRPERHACPVSVWRLLDRSRALAWLASNPDRAAPEMGQGELFPDIKKPLAATSGYLRGM